MPALGLHLLRVHSFGRLLGAALLAAQGAATAAGGPLGIDHTVTLDEHGIWSRRDQRLLEFGVVGVEIAGAVWFGDSDRLGHSFWQAIDASAISAVAAAGLKSVFSRARPSAGTGPYQWFKGAGNRSFPSGEVTLQAAFVTPLIANHAGREPWLWALEALPAYVGIARLKSQAHWQTDVLAGWALGTATGYWAVRRDAPLSVQLLPRGVSIGYSTRF